LRGGSYETVMKKSFVIGAVLILATSFMEAQPQPIVSESDDQWTEIYDPPYKVATELPASSPLRKELFELLRLKATPRHKFEGSLKAYRNWAVFFGRTVDKDGKSIKNPPMGNDDAAALWLRTRDGWRLVDYSFGHSDAFFVVWSEQYGVSRELLGMDQEPEADKFSN
jgi:hypothetical protein